MAPRKNVKQEDLEQLAREFNSILHEFTYQSKEPTQRHEERVAFIENIVRVARGDNLHE